MDTQKEKIRVLLTEQCNANCASCFNKNIRNGLHMDLKDFRMLMDYLSSNGIRFIKIMGGEPTVHPYFEESIRTAQDKMDGVFVFTNALNPKIKNIRVREADLVIYNFLFINKTFDFEKLLLDQPGDRILEVQISSMTDIDDLTSRLGYFFSNVPKDRIKISLTLDCMEDIFMNRDAIITKWNHVISYILKDLHKLYYFDHSIPWCFFENTDMKIRREVRLCNVNCAGLITADLRLQHCNQYQRIGLTLKTQDGLIPYGQLLNSLQKMNEEKFEFNKRKICSRCRNFKTNCNGGCFMHKNCSHPAGISLDSQISDMEY